MLCASVCFFKKTLKLTASRQDRASTASCRLDCKQAIPWEKLHVSFSLGLLEKMASAGGPGGSSRYKNRLWADLGGQDPERSVRVGTGLHFGASDTGNPLLS